MTTIGMQAHSNSLQLAVLLLAAGEGSRLGSIPKALLKKDGQTLLRRFCQAIEPCAPIEFLLVTGFHDEAIKAELTAINSEMNLRNTLVHNNQASLGQSSSVRLGIESLQSDYDVLLIALSDQSEIKHTDIAALLNQFENREAGREIILPIVDGQRGNPVLFSKQVIQKVLAIPGMVCRKYMDENPELVQSFISDQQAYILDVDTGADMQRLNLQHH